MTRDDRRLLLAESATVLIGWLAADLDFVAEDSSVAASTVG